MPNQECAAEYGTVIAIGLQLVQAAPTFTGTGEGDIKTLAPWTTQIASVTATGIRIIPVSNFVQTPGEAITTGGNDNTTYRAVPKLVTGGFTQYTALLEGYTPASAKAARDYTTFTRTAGGRTRLRAFLLTDTDYIAHASDFNGIEIFTWFVSDPIRGASFRETDNYNLSFTAPYLWSESLVYSKASFVTATLQNA